MFKKTYKIFGLDCASCASMIEINLEDAGIKANCSYQKQTLEVEIKDKDEEKNVMDIVKKSGYNIK
jgi:hypothetical protein